jgi:hypothetical protein
MHGSDVTQTLICRKTGAKKAPPKRGLVWASLFLLFAYRSCTDYFDLDAPVRLQAVDQLLLIADFTLR